MGNLKKFVGEYAYNIIKNTAVDNEALRKALVTPQNARAVFSDLNESEIKALCTEISNSGTIGQIRETTQEDIVKAFNSVGYDRVIFDDETAILECKKYYKQGEAICTYNNLQSRMTEYHMLVAVKTNIDKIERSIKPQRDDQYGTSILNIQIAKNGSHMSIKNRYNHTVSQPDSTLNNNLDILYTGLQSMVLGYYGFASLSNLKAHYNNIVNIGNVYLKYHTEQNNIYYGSFVLDSANGARFTDSSRYYVTGKKNNNDYHNRTLVLDFKKKIAIDVSQNKTNLCGKAPLLTRALQEGILSSANKTETGTLKAVFQEVAKELLASRKQALKYIHEVYGYDFTKPYAVTGFLGRFTAKSMEKVTGSNTGILLIYSEGQMRVCELCEGKFYTKNSPRMSDYNIGIFYNQRDFEIERKGGNAAIYLVQQEKQYVGKPKSDERKTYYYHQRYPEFDNGGNNITETRKKLSHRLANYKTEKRAKEVAKIDYTQDITEIENSFAELKETILMRLSKAETTKDYEKIENVMNYRFVWMVRDIENIKKHANEKSFTSVASATSKIDEVKRTIIEYESKLG